MSEKVVILDVLSQQVMTTRHQQSDLHESITRAAVDGTPSQIPAFLPITSTLGSRSHNMQLSTFYIMWPMQLWSLKLICPMVKEEMDLQGNTLYDLDLVVKVTQNVVQCPPNHMTYAPAKFEVATSNSLGEDGFTRK